MLDRAAKVFAFLLLGAGTALAAPPPQPTRWATDEASFLTEGTRARLDERLEAYERQSGHHVLVWIAKTSGGVPIEDFAVQAFASWKVGRKGFDDGLVLFVLADDKTLRIEVGYGLEGVVPDATASRIIRNVIVPRIKAGDKDGAITAGVGALLEAIEGHAPPGSTSPEGEEGAAPEGAPASSPGPSLGQEIFIGIVVLAFLALLVTNPSLAIYLLFSILSGGRDGGGSGGGGGYSGGGGGYSGGGGRSGGGGASGSW